MTFPTAEDKNPLSEILSIQRTRDYYDDGDGDIEKEKFESLKQQILSEHEIVERLKEKIKEIETNNAYHSSQGCGTSILQSQPFLELLKSILENKPQ